MGICVPSPLRPGSLVAVVAPASPFAREELMRGLAWLRTRYRLDVSPSILERTGYLAGSDARRSAELARAMTSPAVEAIVCARGGYGATRIVSELPWDAFARQPKWIVGFSDVTALHTMAAARSVASVHGPNVTGLGRTITPRERASLLRCLERPSAGVAWNDLTILHRGAGPAEGPLVGGNLALVVAMAGAGQLAIPKGAVLVLEDVTERPYRIDRMLTTLLAGGYLGRASAIVFGGFTQCEPGPDGVTVEQVLAERTASLGIPVLANAPFGHGAPNEAFVLGVPVRVSGGSVSPS